MDDSLNPHLKYSLAEMRRRLYEWGDKPHLLSDSEVLQRFIVLRDRYVEPVLYEDSGGKEEQKPIEAPAPKPPPIVEEKNWIFVQHLRKEPGPKRLPHEREVTELKGVPSTADIEVDGSLYTSVDLPADGKALKVEVPVGAQSIVVVCRNDHGGAYEIVDQPYPNPFTDETKSPSAGQLYWLKRKIGA